MTDPIPDLLTADELAEARPLSRGFYQRGTEEVARDLLGNILVRRHPDGVAAVRIDEVEAYLGIDDPACHTFGGRRTQRTETMWGRAGHIYVYLIYGIHNCLNIVTVGEGTPEAVLIRGATPVLGASLIHRRRGESISPRSLLDGPGKLSQALAITRTDDGVDLCDPGGPVSIRTDGTSIHEVHVDRLPRVGIDYAGEAARWPLRFSSKRWSAHPGSKPVSRR